MQIVAASNGLLCRVTERYLSWHQYSSSTEIEPTILLNIFCVEICI